MKIVPKFNNYSEMGEEQGKKFAKFILSNYRLDVDSFLETNKEYIKSFLSPKRLIDIFEVEVIKQEKLQTPFLSKILSGLSNSKFRNLISKLIKSSFNKDKELSKSISEEKEIEQEDFIKTFASFDDKDREKIMTLFELLGIETSFDKEAVKKYQESAALEDLRKTLKDKEEEIKKLKKEAESKEKEHKKELENQRKESEKNYKEGIKNIEKEKEKVVKERDETINSLKLKLKEAESNKSVVASNKTEDQPLTNQNTQDNVDIIKNNEEYNNKKPSIDFETAKEDLQSRTLLGVVKAEGIQPENDYVIVNPIIPIINENSNIDKEDFVKRVDYRSDYSTFMLRINTNTLRLVLSREEAEEYQYYTNDQKFNCLFEAFCKKILFFTPQFIKLNGGDKYKLNAHLLCKPVDYVDFNNSTFVPSYHLSKKDFENKINKHEDLVLSNYPYSLSSNLRYIFVKDSIYEINYIPKSQSTDGKYVCWKYNDQSTKEPFKKLDIKITDGQSDKYIMVPSINNEPDNLYVRNIMFIQTSTKANTIFDEEEFINNISENAKSKNLYYNDNDLKYFHVAVKSSNLVILAGPSGIGKTRLPTVYANTLGLDTARNTVLFVPISPSFLEPEDVLGYVKPISNNINSDSNNDDFNAEYMESQTGLVSFLIDAEERKDKIHLVIFDEMNLSQIEHWFAPFISLLEQDSDSRELKLYSDKLKIKNNDKYPSSINIGENVFFIGTVNVDETTKQISDRLLDRAIVINLAAPSFTQLKEMGKAKEEIYPETSFSKFSAALKKVENSATIFNDRQFQLINDLNKLLSESAYQKSISFRSLNKMALYYINSLGILTEDSVIDFIVSQIVVKKINGSREELNEIISDDDERGILRILNDYKDISEFSLSKKIVQQKCLELDKYGFTR